MAVFLEYDLGFFFCFQDGSTLPPRSISRARGGTYGSKAQELGWDIQHQDGNQGVGHCQRVGLPLQPSTARQNSLISPPAK